MIKNTFIAGITFVAVLVGFSAGSSQALADGVDTMEQVTVVAPRINKAERVPNQVSKVVTARGEIRIAFDDLDLTRVVDVRLLEERINEAVTNLCQQLKQDLPFGQPETPVCILRTVNDAMAQVEQATEYAIASSR